MFTSNGASTPVRRRPVAVILARVPMFVAYAPPAMIVPVAPAYGVVNEITVPPDTPVLTLYVAPAIAKKVPAAIVTLEAKVTVVDPFTTFALTPVVVIVPSEITSTER